MESFKNISLWMDQLDLPLQPRPAISEDTNADVVIMGAGYTGLWTAYYLKQHAPALNIIILEAKVAGFGASGRNGGWLMGEIMGQDKLLAKSNHQTRTQAHSLLHKIPDEVARVLKKENIDCDFKKGGVLYVAARYPEQTTRLKEFYQETLAQDYEEQDHQWLEGESLCEKIKIHQAQGGVYSPHCASIQPAKLVRGLAEVVEKMGVKIYENSEVIQWEKGCVNTSKAKVTASWIVPALEAYGAQLKNGMAKLSQYHLPVQSLIIATEPLSDEIWESMGMENGEVFSDTARQVTYGNRTADNRLVFGARGTYQFGAKLRDDFTLNDDEIQLRQKIMVELFPQLKDAKITHAWGGNLAMSRDFHPHMTIDRKNQFAVAGGYSGEGVGATNLAGRTLADLILNRDSELITMPWVNNNSSLKALTKWEPEPIPWLGYRSVIHSFDLEDRTLSNANSSKLKRKVSNEMAKFMEKFIQ